MSIVSAIVLFAVIWFLTLLCVLPVRMETQGDVGEIVEGTHASAPANLNMKRKAWITTIISFGLWVVLAWVILFSGLTIRDIDFFNRMGPPTIDDTRG